jgi:hypothetical protein
MGLIPTCNAVKQTITHSGRTRRPSFGVGMIAEYIHQLGPPDHLHSEHLKFVDVPLEGDVI